MGLLQGCSSLFYQPTDIRYTDPARFGVVWEDHFIARPGGGSLCAALIRNPRGQGSRGLIVQFHGNAQNLTSHWLSMRWAVQRDWDVLVWDYSGYGASDGTPEREQIARDASAFLDWVSDSILPHQPGPVVLVGQSLGSAILLDAFPHWKDRQKVTLLVSEGGFLRYRDMAYDIASRHWMLYPLYPFSGVLVSEAHSPLDALSALPPTPLLVVSCQMDQGVPPQHQRRIHEASPGSRFWSIEGCPHISAFRSDSVRMRFANLVDSLSFNPP